MLNQLCLPVKNAFGHDISPDRKQQLYGIEAMVDSLQDRRARCQDLADVRKLKLQQILQLRTCDQDAEQVFTQSIFSRTFTILDFVSVFFHD